MNDTVKNSSTLFSVLNIRKVKTNAGSINVVAHNLRQKINKSFLESIDVNFSHFNIYEGVLKYKEFTKKYNEIIENAHIKRKIQRNASRAIEFVFSFTHEYSEGWQNSKNLKEKIDHYFYDCINFIKKKYGKTIISSTVHYDETTPHIHIMCIPLIYSKDGNEAKFSSSEFLGGISGLKSLHTSFHNEVGKKYGLARGIEGSRATHIELKQFKAKEETKIQNIENLEEAIKIELEEIEKVKRDLERRTRELEITKIRIQSIQNDLMKRDAELSIREQELLSFDKDVPEKPPEIPVPPLNLTENSRISWRVKIQELVDNSFNIVKQACQSFHLKYNKLLIEFKKLLKENENLKNRADKAENDLAEKPINEIIADREKMNNEKIKVISKGGYSQ